MQDPNAPINILFNRDHITEIIDTEGKSFQDSWFGQLDDWTSTYGLSLSSEYVAWEVSAQNWIVEQFWSSNLEPLRIYKQAEMPVFSFLLLLYFIKNYFLISIIYSLFINQTIFIQ